MRRLPWTSSNGHSARRWIGLDCSRRLSSRAGLPSKLRKGRPNAPRDPPPPSETAPLPAATPDAERGAERVNLYVPRILQQHLVDHPETRGWTVEGTAAFVDTWGLASLCQRMATKDKDDARGDIGPLSLLTQIVSNGRQFIVMKCGADSCRWRHCCRFWSSAGALSLEDCEFVGKPRRRVLAAVARYN